jgi:DNA-binding IclR family transcriptional regulator
MELHGTIASNLEAALSSAARLRGHPVYKETITYWSELLHQARRARERGVAADDARLAVLISRLEAELADRNKRPS